MRFLKPAIIISITGFLFYGLATSAINLGGGLLGAPTNDQRFERSLIPETDSTYYLGTSTKAWKETTSDSYCLTGDDCITTWPEGGEGSMVYPGAGIALSNGSAWGTSITNNSANWDTAYGWGNHAGIYDVLGQATSTLATHNSAYNHTTFITASTTQLTASGNIWAGGFIGPLTGTASGNLISGGTLTTNYHCRYDGTGIDCDRVEDASGACSSNAVCMGGHTHVGVNEVYGSGWDADTATPEKDDIYDYLHQMDTDDDGNINVLDTDAVDTITEIAAALKDGSGDCSSGLICLGDHSHSQYVSASTTQITASGDIWANNLNATEYVNSQYFLSDTFDGFGGDLYFYSANGTASTPTASLADDALGAISFYGHNGTDYDFAASLYAKVDSVAGESVLSTLYFEGNNVNFNGDGTLDFASGGALTLDAGGVLTLTSSEYVSMGKASTTHLTVSTDSWLGTIKSGTWNGSDIDISDYTNLTASGGIQLNGDNIEPAANYSIPLTASTTEWANSLKSPTFKACIASTSVAFTGGGYLPIPQIDSAYTVKKIRCNVIDGTSYSGRVSDATNHSDTITCDVNGENDDGSLANATVTAGEQMYWDFVTLSGAVNYVCFSIYTE